MKGTPSGHSNRLLLAPLFGLALAALAAAPGALAKGAAISGSPPQDPDAGETWTATVRLDPPDLARHVDVAPAVVLRSAGGEMRFFRAEPTKTQGAYEAEVTFPRAGRWSYAATIAPGVDPPASHFVPLHVGLPSSGSRVGGGAAAALVVAVALALATVVAVRRRLLLPARA